MTGVAEVVQHCMEFFFAGGDEPCGFARGSRSCECPSLSHEANGQYLTKVQGHCFFTPLYSIMSERVLISAPATVRHLATSADDAGQG